MAEEIRQPTPPDYAYGQFKDLPGTAGIPSAPDTFVGPHTKHYLDFLSRQMTRLRGSNVYYYVKDDQSQRIDGDRPMSNSEKAQEDALARKRHAGNALYGEQVIVGETLDSVRQEIQPDWPYLAPILVRGVAAEISHEFDPDERGSIYVTRMRFDLARVLCEKEWRFIPKPGDVIRFVEKFNGYFDVDEVEDEEGRAGSSGFRIFFTLRLVHSTKYEPQRKIAAQKTTSDEEIEREQTTGEDPAGDQR